MGDDREQKTNVGTNGERGALILLVSSVTVFSQKLTPEQAKQHQNFIQKGNELTKQLQEDMAKCGDDQACMMNLVFKMQSLLAKQPLPENSGYKSTGCGLLASSWSNCIPVTIKITLQDGMEKA